MTARDSVLQATVDGWRADLQQWRRLLRRGSGSVHLVGIGGVGMAGLARLLQHRGFAVRGSDSTPSRMTDWLGALGIDVMKSHCAGHVASHVACVIRTPAVADDNPELLEARSRGIPVIARGVALPALLDGTQSVAVCGTHGKTTTSAMVTHVLSRAGLDPSFCIGGELNASGAVAGIGEGDYMVVEADESDGTLQLYEPHIGVITNIEHDHMEHFPSRDAFVDCFRQFAAQVRDDVIYCVDDPSTASLLRAHPRALGFGLCDRAAVHGRIEARRPAGTDFSFRFETDTWHPVSLPVPGDHNVQNALGAVAVALRCGVGVPQIQDGLSSFCPVRRRFELVVHTDAVDVVSDYAHHPSEIRAVVQTAAERRARRIVAIFQPHRYTRTRALLDAFPAAFAGIDDLVLVPVYGASESPIQGGTSADLLEACLASGETPVRLAPSLEAAWKWVRDERRTGDLLLILGAGDVERVASWAQSDLE